MNTPTQIQIVAQGTGWFAVNKPAGMSVHNQKGGDLVSCFPEYETVFLLNRLDVPVSGIVMLATSKSVASAIQQQFADRAVEKRYRAIGVAADPSCLAAPGDGIWKQPLTKKAENRRKPAGFGGRRVPCRTLWQVERVDGDHVHLILTPETGRKHQLRRHAAIAGWPLLGDDRYGPERAAEAFDGRIALHADRLVFCDPETGASVEVTCPVPW
jgi:23S rRNA-/tRNA-specific pseudouridylate synthase